ncbi:MAG: hypothetical protein ACLU38_16080 [Dysosmobacter sp.]
MTALPVTAFAETAAHETNASLHETTLDGIANDITRQVLRSSQKDGERIQMENTAKLDDSDEVEIIVVVNDSVADPDSRAQVNALLRTQKSALAQIERALDTKVEPQRQYTTLLNGFSATVTYGQYKAIWRSWTASSPPSFPPTFELLPDTANSNRMIGGGTYQYHGLHRRGDAGGHSGYRRGHGPPGVQQAAPKSPCPDAGNAVPDPAETSTISRWRASSRASASSNLYYSAKIPLPVRLRR